MTKTMTINELISKLKEYDGELPVKVWSGGAEKPYPISNVAAGTMCAYIGIDDRNLVDLSKIWHDASEDPNKPNPIMIEIDDDIDPTYEVITVDGKDNKFWKFLASDMDMTRWAYISDLLPKGGEV